MDGQTFSFVVAGIKAVGLFAKSLPLSYPNRLLSSCFLPRVTAHHLGQGQARPAAERKSSGATFPLTQTNIISNIVHNAV